MAVFYGRTWLVLRWLHLLVWAVALSAFAISTVHAKVVISEAMWMGADLSTSDEWVELTGLGSGSTNLKGWRLTRLNTSGVEADIITFGSGDTLGSGEVLVVSRFPVELSRLSNPSLLAVAPDMSLPNTKLLLRLRNASGTVVDLVDDGVGNPFAGANPSGGIKASMERINLWGSGGLLSNWRTATTILGWDDGAVLRGTPGFANGTGPTSDVYPPIDVTSLSGFFVQMGSGYLLVVRWVPSTSLDLASQQLIVTPMLLSGEGSVIVSKTTTGVTLIGAAGGSGYTIRLISTDLLGHSSTGSEIQIQPFLHSQSSSNEQESSSIISSSSEESSSSSSDVLSASGASFISSVSSDCGSSYCDTTLIQSSSSAASSSSESSFSSTSSFSSSSFSSSSSVQSSSSVVPTGSTGGSGPKSSSSSSLCGISYSSAVVISEFLPRPVGSDADEEWIELQNTGSADVDLCGWSLDDADGGSKAFNLTGLVIKAGEYLLLSRPITGLALNDGGDHVRLLAGTQLMQDIPYTDAPNGYAYARQGDDFYWSIELTPGHVNVIVDPTDKPETEESSGATRVQVTHIVDGDTFDAITRSGSLIRVRLIGVDAPELGSVQPFLKENSIKASQLIEDLIINTSIELQFDTTKIDPYGRTLAYPILADGRTVQEELLRQGLAVVVEKYKFAKKNEFLGYQSEAKAEKLGIWAIADSQVLAYTETGSFSIGSGKSVLEVVLSEVYPAPKTGSGVLDALQKEWIELFNPTDHVVDLSGWTLDDVKDGGSKPWTFPLGFLIDAFSYKVLFSQDTGLKLNDDVDDVWLISPDGTVSDHMRYEKLKKGQSLARIEGQDTPCVTVNPTPGMENDCEDPVTAPKTVTKQTSSPKSAPKKIVKAAAPNKGAAPKKIAATKPTSSKTAKKADEPVVDLSDLVASTVLLGDQRASANFFSLTQLVFLFTGVLVGIGGILAFQKKF